MGGRPENLLQYIRFERAAKGLSQGHRKLLADKFADLSRVSPTAHAGDVEIPRDRLHALAHEFELTSDEILDLIQSAPRLKMAVRGWVAERHLVDQLGGLAELQECSVLEGEGQPDVRVQLPGRRPILIECKNILRNLYADGSYKLDFQRTRASKSDPCSRYYSSNEFQIVAACLHPRTETWEFRYALTQDMEPHMKCPGRISNRVRVDEQWECDPMNVIRQASVAA